jgi:FtsP/CotA-like multicopper oxidase with cupredoxin domain
MPTRRQLAAGGAAALLASFFAPRLERGLAQETAGRRTVSLTLQAAERSTTLPCFGGAALPLWTFAEGAWPVLIRLDRGDRLEVTLGNHLSEHTSIHWHGIRLPNDQDGVPYLIQRPVGTGESFRYAFTPPDAGTFWFHTHCNTVEQLGRGLAGILIVNGDVTEPYDADLVLTLRDWRIEPGSNRFASFTTLRGAGRAGTYGPLRSVNGAVQPEFALPASGDCRLRVLNVDPTRVMRVGVEGAEAALIAIDGLAISPMPLGEWLLGPGMRADLLVRAPAAGVTARVVDTSADGYLTLATLKGAGPPRRPRPFDPAPLGAPLVARPDLATATRLAFRFQSVEAGVEVVAEAPGDALGPICATPRTFWTINGRAWPDRDHATMPPPLAVLERGRSYVFSLRNDTAFVHPIHIHGHSVSWLSSSLRTAPAHHADTILLLPGEVVEVAFVADNPGDWMFHCHVIEHQEYGMMGYLRIA